MRFVWLAFIGLVVLMVVVVVLPSLHSQKSTPNAGPKAAVVTPDTVRPAAFTSLRTAPSHQVTIADSVVAFGLAQRGTPYVYAGTSPLTGFDCSGFIMYTFAHFNVAVPHSTALLIDVGRPVARTEARPGDIVVFTGTAATSTTPGHAGIVISAQGEVPLRFVHASSSRREPFVKVSQVEDSDYERRFMQVRRVLGPGEVATTRPKVPVLARMGTAVATLPVRTVPVDAPASPLASIPKKLAPKKLAAASHLPSKKKPVMKKPLAKATAPQEKTALATKRNAPAKTTLRPAAKKRAAH